MPKTLKPRPHDLLYPPGQALRWPGHDPRPGRTSFQLPPCDLEGAIAHRRQWSARPRWESLTQEVSREVRQHTAGTNLGRAASQLALQGWPHMPLRATAGHRPQHFAKAPGRLSGFSLVQVESAFAPPRSLGFGVHGIASFMDCVLQGVLIQ